LTTLVLTANTDSVATTIKRRLPADRIETASPITDHQPPSSDPWSYEEAFSRNLGLITPDEQNRLRHARVAIAGMGGVGGLHLTTLARLGIGKFTIADPDVFEVANFNRQVGATTATLGRRKVDVMAAQARLINPEAEIHVIPEAIDKSNIEEFFDNANLFVDGIDFFHIEARRLLFAEARRRGLWGITAGPIGLGSAWMTFDPNGMSFEEYFNFPATTDRVEQLISFAIGLTPKGLHLRYMDLSRVRNDTATVPCSGCACDLAAAVVANESLRILTRRRALRPAPWFHQFDPYVGRYATGKLRGGNRHPIQRLKRWWLRRRFNASRLQ
jgi:molybdopterin/thiamine biosynthesis adenylyltransferase